MGPIAFQIQESTESSKHVSGFKCPLRNRNSRREFVEAGRLNLERDLQGRVSAPEIEESEMNKSRQLIPEWAKPHCRHLRAKVLSLGLRPRGPFSLGDEDRQVSARMSVIVAVHDAPETTSRCLRSLEVFGGDAEVIVVDDGSRLESTKNLLAGACSRNGWRLIRNDKPLGHSRASEAGRLCVRETAPLPAEL